MPTMTNGCAMLGLRPFVGRALARRSRPPLTDERVVKKNWRADPASLRYAGWADASPANPKAKTEARPTPALRPASARIAPAAAPEAFDRNSAGGGRTSDQNRAGHKENGGSGNLATFEFWPKPPAGEGR